MLVCKSPILLIRFCLDPITMSLVLEGWDWSLLTFNQSVTFSMSEFRSLASFTETFEESKAFRMSIKTTPPSICRYPYFRTNYHTFEEEW